MGHKLFTTLAAALRTFGMPRITDEPELPPPPPPPPPAESLESLDADFAGDLGLLKTAEMPKVAATAIFSSSSSSSR